MRSWLGRLYVLPAMVAMALAAAVGTSLVLPLLLLPTGRREGPSMAVAAAWSWFMVKVVLLTRVTVEGEKTLPEGGYLVISNHRAWLDSPLLVMYTRAAGVAKKELVYIPFFGLGARATGTLFFDRKDPASRSAVLEQATATLRRGGRLHVFPEGTRTRDGCLASRVHLRIVEAAAAAGVPVVPACTWDTERVLPSVKNEVWPGRSAGVAFGPPLRPEPGEAAFDFGARCWAMVIELADRHGANQPFRAPEPLQNQG